MPAPAQNRVNDFVIKIATVNGTGSASANGLLMKAVFRSGVPVGGKNYFPSNIQGMPTWYEIRVTRDGYRARSGQVDIMVALNAETYARDLQEVASGGYFLYDSTWPRAALMKRDDITVLGVPFARLCNENFQGVRTRILMKNICYAGALAALCDLDLDVIRGLLAETYAKKPKLVDANMQEFLGLAYYTETPTVLFDVQRVGPSTGMPTRTQQGDLRSAAYASHGDTRQVCMYPANPEECFQFALQAFHLADRLQTPVLVLSDIDIGMNDWMCPEFKWDENYVPDRGKVLNAEQLAGMEKFWRYYDHDNDGIPQRTIPGVSSRGAYFARGSGHNQYGGYTPGSREYQLVLDRLGQKQLTAPRMGPAPVIEATAGTELGIVTVGSGDAPVREAIARLRTQGVQLDYMRVRAFPFGEEVERFLNEHKANFIVEQNRDAQLRGLLTLETGVEKSRLRSILHYNGMPLAAGYVVAGVMAAVQDQARPAAQLVRQ